MLWVILNYAGIYEVNQEHIKSNKRAAWLSNCFTPLSMFFALNSNRTLKIIKITRNKKIKLNYTQMPPKFHFS